MAYQARRPRWPWKCWIAVQSGTLLHAIRIMQRRRLPDNNIQYEAEVCGNTPEAADNWGKDSTNVAVLIDLTLNWTPVILMRAMQLRVELFRTVVGLFVHSFLPFL